MIEIPIRAGDAPRPTGALRISNRAGEVIFDLVQYEYRETEVTETIHELVAQTHEDARQTARALKALCRVAAIAEELESSLETELGVTVDSQWGGDQDFEVDLNDLPPGVETLQED